MAVQLVTPLDRRIALLDSQRRERKESGLDKVMKALQVAQGVTGIVSNVSNIRQRAADQETKKIAEQNKQVELGRQRRGELTQGEFQDTVLKRGLQIGEQGQTGAIPIKVQGAQGVETRFVVPQARPLTEKEQKLIGLQTREIQQKISLGEEKVKKAQQEQAAKKAKVEANLQNLDTQIARLSPRQQDGQSLPPEVETGPLQGTLSKLPLASVTRPGLTDVQNNLENIIFQSVRETFGSQVTKEEVVRLVNTTFNPQLSNQRNLERLNRLRDQIRASIKSGDVKQFKRLVPKEGRTESSNQTLDKKRKRLEELRRKAGL